ncbi:HpsJ family protein [Nostoc sp. CHAB 5844]|nr:HpsJ family protein [Nostoc sp. CHAB 5844]
MTKSNSDKIIPVIQELQEFAFSQVGSMTILRVLGYGLLLLALFDIIETFVPPSFMNPVWEFQTFGAIVERIPVTLIGLALVFYGELHARAKWELLTLRLLSWISLLLAILFILLIPVGVSNTIRLSKQSYNQISNLSQQQLSQAEQVEQRLSQAKPEQIESFLKSQGRSLEANSPQELKQKVLSEVSQAKEKIKLQAKANQSTQRLNLLKNSVKWNLGALVTSALFFIIWKTTNWARNK